MIVFFSSFCSWCCPNETSNISPPTKVYFKMFTNISRIPHRTVSMLALSGLRSVFFSFAITYYPDRRASRNTSTLPWLSRNPSIEIACVSETEESRARILPQLCTSISGGVILKYVAFTLPTTRDYNAITILRMPSHHFGVCQNDCMYKVSRLI